MSSNQAVPSHISAVDFGFLTSLEIKNLAVKKITNPISFNSLLHPNNGGLHDPALGSHRNTPCVLTPLKCSLPKLIFSIAAKHVIFVKSMAALAIAVT
jgi:hypothetical protein